MTIDPTTCPSGSCIPVRVLLDVLSDLDNFARRAAQEAIAQRLPDQLEARAEQWEAARPQPGEFTGAATPEELSRRWRECTEAAQALRNAAELARRQEWDAHCCAALTLDELAEAGRRGLVCGGGLCARGGLARLEVVG